MSITFFLNEEGFEAKSNQIMIFEAFVSGKDKQKDKPEDPHEVDATYYGTKLCSLYK